MKLQIQGDYPPDWPEINARVCEEVGHRCVRCHHPYRKGTHGSGEWTACDEKCTHFGPLGVMDDLAYALSDKCRLSNPDPFDPGMFASGAACANFRSRCMMVVAHWRILTVHHMDGNKANCEWWNLLALCQRCHLSVQGNVNPNLHYFLEHSEWFKPYAAGFYAKKYEQRDITRAEAITRMDELLAYERRA